MKKSLVGLMMFFLVAAPVLAKPGDAVGPQDMEVGKIYKFNRETVMSDVMDPVVVHGQPMAEFKLVYPKFNVTVREKVYAGDVVWYRIDVYFDKKLKGEGWVNSYSLSKLTIVEFR